MTKGTVYYGMHFYPGVAEYAEPGKDPYRVFLNEDTIRSMGPSFAGRPIFVEHVQEVEEKIDLLRGEADGWVLESFFNAADGKHWVKFIIVSEAGENAIKSGMKLSNAYHPTGFTNGGLWNGVQYQKEVTGGEYEHLAIVRHPRYEESEILTPEKFKKYNADKAIELTRLTNSKDPKEKIMKFNLFKKTKFENSAGMDIESLSVILPKSGKEKTITQLVNEADEMEVKKDKANAEDGEMTMASMDHKVKTHDGVTMNVGDLLDKHKTMCDELASMKKNDEGAEADLETAPTDVDVEGDLSNEEDDAEAEEKKKKENEDAKAKEEKKMNAIAKAKALKNAHFKNGQEEEVATVRFSGDQVKLGQARYGSGA